MGNHKKKRAKKRQQKQREFLKNLGLFGEKCPERQLQFISIFASFIQKLRSKEAGTGL